MIAVAASDFASFDLASLLASAAPASVQEVAASSLSPTGWTPAWAFWILSALVVIGAISTIAQRNLISAVMSLVATFFGLAGLYATLSAHFLAAIQVLVYAGAIMVLFVFVVMSVGHRDREELGFGRGRLSKGLGIVAVAILLMRLIPLLKTAKLGPAATVPDGFGDVRSVGKLLFNEYLLPFEAISILLLVAIVGAVMITRRPTREPGQPPERKGV